MKAPPGVTSGPIRVNAPGGSWASSANFYAPPVITGFAPSAGLAGTTVYISGTNLLGAMSVLFGSTTAPYTVLNNNTIQATVPAGVSSSPVRVNVPAGSFTTTTNFRMQPSITSFAPSVVMAGSMVTISGAALNEGLSSVQFNGVNASFNPPIYGQVNAIVPAGAATGPITVTTTNGSFTTPNRIYLPPSITSFAPTNSAVGSTVTISGANFLEASVVRFNGLSASFTAPANNTTLTAVVPLNVTTGPISVSTPAGTALSTDWFYGPPAISGFSPTHGLPGNVVTISGNNLLGATRVQFANLNAASFTVVNNTTIQATVPSGASNGVIRVTTPANTVSSAGTFALDYTAEVSVLISATPDPISLGSNVVYLISVFNDGPYSAGNVRLTNTLSSLVDLVGATTTRGTLNTNGNPVFGNLGQVNSGEIITVTLTARTKSTGYATNTVRVANDYPDPISTNNVTSIRTLVQPLPRLIASLPSATTVAVSWSAALSNYTLQARETFSPTAPWTNVTTAPVTVGGLLVVTEPRGAQPRFYRLRR